MGAGSDGGTARAPGIGARRDGVGGRGTRRAGVLWDGARRGPTVGGMTGRGAQGGRG
jgi:hypothetical protein